MKRREFITLVGGAVAWPLAAHAQQPAKQHRIAFVHSGIPTDQLSETAGPFWVRRFYETLRGLGETEGGNLVVERYSAEGRADRFAPLAAEVVSRNPDVIVCVLFEGGEHGRLAARLATQVIKAYVDKQRRQPTKMAAGSGKVEIGSLWTDPGGTDEDGKNASGDRLQGGRFLIDVARKRTPLAVAAPGMH